MLVPPAAYSDKSSTSLRQWLLLRTPGYNHIEEFSQALGLIVRSADSVPANLREIVFELQASMSNHPSSVYKFMDSWAGLLSPITLRVTYAHWDFFDTRKPIAKFAETFMTMGAEICRKLVGRGFKQTTRHWRVFSVITEVGRQHLKDHMGAMQYRKALDWIENGV